MEKLRRDKIKKSVEELAFLIPEARKQVDFKQFIFSNSFFFHFIYEHDYQSFHVIELEILQANYKENAETAKIF